MRLKWLGLLLPLLVLLACGRTEKIVGTWTSQHENAGNPVTESATFHADGRYESVSFMGKEAGIGLRTTDIGRWKKSGDDKLTITLSDVRWEALGVSPERAKQSILRLEAAKPTMIAEVNAMGPIPIKWIDDDTHEMTIQEKGYRYLRKK